MRRMALLLSGLLLVLAACGDKQETVAPTGDATGSGNKDGNPPAEDGGEPGADGTLWAVTNMLSLVGVDLATGEDLLPPSLDTVTAVLAARYGNGAAAWFARLAETVPEPFLAPVSAAALGDAAAEILYVCRRQ